MATKIANEYQKPTLILNETELDGQKIWTGSGRIFSQSNFTFFRRFVDESGFALFGQGHESAFGAAFPWEAIPSFTEYANRELADFDFTPKYHLDFIYDVNYLTPTDIFNVASFDWLWG